MKHFSTVPFEDSPDLRAEYEKFLARHKDEPDAAIRALEKAQDLYGYLPEEIQQRTADALGLSFDEIHGMAVYHSQFRLCPVGKYQIRVCLGTACHVRGSSAVYEKLQQLLHISGGECTPDRKFSLEVTNCLGLCGSSPTMTVNDDVYYSVTPDSLVEILSRY